MSMRWPTLLVMLLGCGHHSGKVDAGEADAFEFKDACTELSCFQFDCASKGLPSTSISGTVYAPNGTLKLYGVDVYVPRSDPGPLVEGVRCEQCSAGLQGGSFAQTRTDENGHFVLENVPATANIPLVIQIGKWRRQITVPTVAACQDLALPVADTRLPKDRSEGDLPQIAISTGAADAIECLVYRLGIAPTEFTAPSVPVAFTCSPTKPSAWSLRSRQRRDAAPTGSMRPGPVVRTPCSEAPKRCGPIRRV